ncbi:MAG: S46 family peptidase [Flavobacteriales bacterium]|nr:S46 family peptidase [Flavobacteriales bacterium]
MRASTIQAIAASLMFAFAGPFNARSHEGMWLPTLLKSIEGDLQSSGLKLSAEDIYSINRSSLKDAIVLFGGGCTAEVISGQGLILTNHHCGFSAITDHSTVENDRLKNGFWAATKADELRNPSLTATFVVRMEDVTERIVPFITSAVEGNEQARRDLVAQLSKTIIDEAVAGTHYKAVVRPFNYGNSYYLIVTETFRDVRLVGAPPASIGKYGGDTDNWMWPRHNADFSLFRIYAGPDGKPSDPSDANVPFAPRHVLPISLEGVKEGDFAMIFGFPGQTQRYLTSYAVEYVQEEQDPARIAMRTASLGVIDAAMASSDRLRLMYADKQAGISNAWKKWIGQRRGLKELRTLEVKRAYEEAYNTKAMELVKPEYAQALVTLKAAYGDYVPFAIARDLYVEMVFYGPELLRFADAFKDLIEQQEVLRKDGKIGAEATKLLQAAEAHFAAHDPQVEKRVMKALLPIYRQHMPAHLLPDALPAKDLSQKGHWYAWVDELYARSAFTDLERLRKALRKPSPGALKRLAKDPGYKLARSFQQAFLNKVKPAHAQLSDRIEGAMRTYVKGMMELYPEKNYWPDANSTLRLSYGKVEGSAPRDGVSFLHYTTLDGVVEKHIPGDAEFDLPQRLIDLYRAKDFGRYGVDGSMPVCFTSSLHTTGGNSGSPVLNGRGELIGLNFDRSWESTMSDIQFDPDKCRNICVDARYILFLIDKFAGAGHLVAEMNLVERDGPRTINLPIHR